MAELEIGGIDDLIRRLERANMFDEQTQRTMLFEGAEIMTQEAKKAMKAHGSSGELARRIGYTKSVKTTKVGARRVSVTVKGKADSGQRYAVIAFVLNYGRHERYGKIPASYAWTRARKNAEPKITKRWEDMLTEKLKTKGLV